MTIPHHTSRSLRTILPVPLAVLALLLLLVGVSSAAPADLPQIISHDQIVAAIIAQVTTPTLAYELAGLTGERPVTVAGISYTIATRNSYQTQPISMATRYAYEQFAGLGLDVTFHNYTWYSNHWRNVVAEKPGVVDPDEIYLITAHIDDLPQSALAPGADDNGSGSVAVLMAAKLLAHRRFAYTVRFVLFTGEEQGLHGSAAYAAACAAAGDNILGVVNLDMIAYNSDAQPIIDLHASASVPQSLELTRIFSDVIGVYGLDLVPDRFVDSWAISRSDQWSFLTRGYPAFLAIEDWSDHTPQYHQTGDTLSTLNLDYYADYTRAAIATIAHLGRLLPGGYLSGTVTDLATGQPLSNVTVAALTPAYQYTFTAPTSSSGAYSLPLPISVYTFTAWAASPGYYPTTTTGVVIITNTVTLQDFALEPWPRLYLPLIAYEY
jgi:hypothetical protein